eukprot:CAMPEP_0195508794 /NCGR_PEP_ID=MMETSP0794_2-20130614/1913_1 /TAXON_ID=515487 /ORGANISM="Stephanopyxis turris, Strain CCMP 815" /LENGTH=376 /DNA_ID=CAMNT_0040635853 /DNA_START=128 /DNA_END=1258 /DNA_ORIENTATION=+
MISKTTPLSVRIVSYNVLSSHLASPNYFTKCKSHHLEAETRLPKIFAKLDAQIKYQEQQKIDDDDKNKNTPVVFCLQEVSYDWAGKFHCFFAQRNYQFVTGLYGRKFNGYMGVALAYPMDDYETVDVDIARLSDEREGGWPERDGDSKSCGWISTVLSGMGRLVMGSVQTLVLKPFRGLLQIAPSNEPIDHWDMSENRHNVMLFARLREKHGKKESFCIANYHMPCAFYAPKVMNMHAEMVVRRTQLLAKGDAHVLAGDFNIMPDSPTYGLVTKGELDAEDETFPNGKNGMEWMITSDKMRSAYAESEHGEPDFTNYAQIRDDDPFIGTLDYIFISKHWKVNGVEEICNRNDAKGPFPNTEEPSDHVLIAANLELG